MSDMSMNELLAEAIEARCSKLVHLSLDRGADPNYGSDEGRGVLGLAIERGDAWTVRMLLLAGANPNHGTPLIWAAQTNRLDLVEMLIEAGSHVAAELDHDSTSVHVAAEEGFTEVLKCLLAADGKQALNRFDYIHRTPLMWAIAAGHLDAAKLLIAAGADVNANDEEHIGNTALHFAADAGSIEAVELLLNAGADPRIEGWTRTTPIDKAMGLDNEAGARILTLLQEAVSRFTPDA